MHNSYQLYHITLASLVILNDQQYRKPWTNQETQLKYIRFSKKPHKFDQPIMQWHDL